jgi:hypothetical protein
MSYPHWTLFQVIEEDLYALSRQVEFAEAKRQSAAVAGPGVPNININGDSTATPRQVADIQRALPESIRFRATEVPVFFSRERKGGSGGVLPATSYVIPNLLLS